MVWNAWVASGAGKIVCDARSEGEGVGAGLGLRLLSRVSVTQRGGAEGILMKSCNFVIAPANFEVILGTYEEITIINDGPRDGLCPLELLRV